VLQNQIVGKQASRAVSSSKGTIISYCGTGEDSWGFESKQYWIIARISKGEQIPLIRAELTENHVNSFGRSQ